MKAGSTEKHTINIQGTPFTIPKKYTASKIIGQGAYGIVVSGVNTETGQNVAIKKIPNAFVNLIDAKRIVREIRILEFFNHENIIHLLDVFMPEDLNNFEDIYFVTELVDTDLHKALYSKHDLSAEHIQYFMYQILRGLFYIHSADIIHRDLKPSNILLTKDCNIKLIDFGLARGFSKNAEMTEYVVTRWYRAPEILLNSTDYSKGIDVWSVGCIFGELLGKKPLFPGNDYLDQMKKIIEVIGTPSPEDLNSIEGEYGKNYIKNLNIAKKKDFASLFPKANKACIDLLTNMLLFNPKKRFTVEDCLRHSYFQELHCPEAEEKCEHVFDWAWDNFVPSKPKLQEMIAEVSSHFNN